MGVAEELFATDAKKKAKERADMDRDRIEREIFEQFEGNKAVADEAEYNRLHKQLDDEIKYMIANPKTDFARDLLKYDIYSPATDAKIERLNALESDRTRYLQQLASSKESALLGEKINLLYEGMLTGDTMSVSAAGSAVPLAAPSAANSKFATVAIAVVSYYLFLR